MKKITPFKIVGLLSLLLVVTSCGLFYPSPEKYFAKATEQKPYDAIIVTGYPYDGNSWTPTVKIRSHWAKYLYENGYTKNIIYSGGAVYSKYSEAKILALYGEALGIPKEHIFIDTNAEHSTENIYYSYQIAKKQGFKTIALATDPFQTNQTRRFIKKNSLPIDLIPIVFDTLTLLDRYEPSINSETAIVDTFVSITERESFFKRFNGTLGNQVIWLP